MWGCNRPFRDGHHIGRSRGQACFSPSDPPELSGKNKGETIMIDALAFAVVAVALGIPALIMATMLGSNLNFDW
jgi:hypothetical protein